jgi:hypothetical protein
MTTAHQMTGVDYIQETFGLTGKGYKVAVVDSGIDYTHPAFGGCTGLGKGEGCRVVAGWDYIGDEFDKTGVVKEDAGRCTLWCRVDVHDLYDDSNMSLTSHSVLLIKTQQTPLTIAVATVPMLLVSLALMREMWVLLSRLLVLLLESS